MIKSQVTKWSATMEPFTIDQAEEIRKALLKSGGCKVTANGKAIGFVAGVRVKDDEVVADIEITSKEAAEELMREFKFTIDPSISHQDK